MLKLMVPMTLMIIFVLLYLAFRQVGEALLIISSVPFALVGGIWLLWWMGFHLSVATGTGFIALAGVAAEFGVVMLMYLRHAIEAVPSLNNPQTFSEQKLDEALYQRRGPARAPESDDGGGDYRRSAADSVGNGGWFRGDEPDCRADDWRHDHRTFAVAVYYPGGV